jgi:tetratricopeptide (TPR) repeat protein
MYLYPITIKAEDNNSIAQQRIWAAKGDSCVQAYDFFHAMQFYNNLTEEFINQNTSVTRNIAELYRRTGNNKAWLNRLLYLHPDSITYNDLRLMFFANKNLGKEDQMVILADTILRTNPYDSEIVVSMASYFNDTKHPDKALELCGDYMQRDSTNLGVMRQYGYAAHLLGNSKEALETYKKLEANGFDNYESALIIGYSLLKLDSAWNARPYLRKAVEKRKEGEYASLLHLGNAYIACGEYGEGIGCLYEVIETITPKNDLYYSLYNSIGEAYYKQKIYEKAAKAFLECTKYKSDNPLVYYNIAQMCKGMKDEKREMRFSKKFLDISHHLEDTPQNKELIQSVEERVEYLSKHATK